jgi:hypothetical protein
MSKKYDPSTNLVVWPDEFNPEEAKWYVYNENRNQCKTRSGMEYLD